MLLTGAGMLVKSLWALLTIDVGFTRDRVVTIQATLPYKKYDQARAQEFSRRLMAELRRVPGVRVIAVADNPPLEAILFPYDLVREGGGRAVVALSRHVGPGYFGVLGIPVLAGRTLEPADDTRIPVPVVVNRRVAQDLFGDVNAVGRLMRTQYKDRQSLQIVGIVGDTRQLGLTENPGPQIYVPVVYGHPQCLIARIAPNAGDLTAPVRQAVLQLDPEVPAPAISSVQANFNRYVAKPRFYTLLLGTFAAVGVLLAAIGIYGVTSYAISRRTREFGVRMAVGAEPMDIFRLVLSGGARLTIAGLVVGLAGSVFVMRLLASMFYAAKSNDAVTIASVGIALVAVGLAACLLPARRATRVNPAVVLRWE
jgi:putative ABC transport system permease protein